MPAAEKQLGWPSVFPLASARRVPCRKPRNGREPRARAGTMMIGTLGRQAAGSRPWFRDRGMDDLARATAGKVVREMPL